MDADGQELEIDAGNFVANELLHAPFRKDIGVGGVVSERFYIRELACNVSDDTFHILAKFVPSPALWKGCAVKRIDMGFDWRDQGWGNRKGQIGLRVVKCQDDELVMRHFFSNKVAPHAFEKEYWMLGEDEDEMRVFEELFGYDVGRDSQSTDTGTIDLSLKAGGGGGHRLHLSALFFTIHYNTNYARRRHILNLVMLIRADRARMMDISDFIRSEVCADTLLPRAPDGSRVADILLGVRLGSQGKSAFETIDDYALGLAIVQLAGFALDLQRQIFSFI